MGELRLLYRALAGYRRYLVLEVLAIAGETSLELAIPLLMARVIDEGLASGNMDLVLRQGAIMVVCALGALVLGLAHARFISLLSNGLGAGLRRAQYEKVQTFSFEDIDRYQTASLVTRMTTDITVVQNAVNNGFRPLVRSPLMLIMGLFYAASINIRLTGVFLITLPVLAMLLALIVGRAAPLYRTLQRSIDGLNVVLREDLTAIRTVKAFVRSDYEQERFGAVNSEVAACSQHTFSRTMLNQPVLQAVMYATSVLVLLFGGQMILAGTLLVGELTGFMSYISQIMNSLMMISNSFLQITRAFASIERCCEVLKEKPDKEASPADRAVRTVEDGSVAFLNVSFAYRPDSAEPVLANVSFEVPAGSTFGILGGTGSGKSSLVQLIARLYDASAGQVLVGGHDVRDYDPAKLHRAVAMVPQKSVLFTGTVRENLRWGRADAPDEELLEACRMACVDEFLDRIGGLDGDLGQGGAGVSGGQRQRLCIARALVAQPHVLVLDDSMSALDVATDAQVRANLAALEDVTVIVIAQRIASVMDADQILVLDDGRVHGVGTHAELLASDNIYQEIYASQMEFAAPAMLKGTDLNGNSLPAHAWEGGEAHG